MALATADPQGSLRKNGKAMEMPDAIFAATVSVHDRARDPEHPPLPERPESRGNNWLSEE